MDFAEADWISVVTEGQAAILVGRIGEVKQRAPAGPQETSGIIQVHVLRELTAGKWQGPQDLEVAFTQFTDHLRRIKSGKVGWNGVEVQPGAFLLMAILPRYGGASPHPPVSPAAVRQLQAPDDEMARGVEQAVSIEAVRDPERIRTLLAQALRSNLPFLEGYAHYALGRLRRIPRPAALDLELAALEDTARSGSQRLASAINLELELWKPGDPEDAQNKRILGAFLRLIPQRNPDLQRTLVESLYRLLVSQGSEDYRRKLLEGVEQPPRSALIGALEALQQEPDIGKEAKALSAALSR